jgi:hypothetical protein
MVGPKYADHDSAIGTFILAGPESGVVSGGTPKAPRSSGYSPSPALVKSSGVPIHTRAKALRYGPLREPVNTTVVRH